MTGDELKAARARLGDLWGLGRALHKAELGRACGLGGADPGQSIADYEAGRTTIAGPTAILIRLYLGGVLPPDGLAVIRKG